MFVPVFDYHIFFTLFMMAMGAYLYRVRGGSMWPRLPKPLEQLLFSLPYGIVTGLQIADWYDWQWGVGVGMAVWFITTGAVILGHGPYFLSLTRVAFERERIDFIVTWLFGEDPRATKALKPLRGIGANDLTDAQRAEIEAAIFAYGENWLYWRCVTGMALSGLVVTIPAGVATLNPFLALSGAWKAVAYMIAKKADSDTEGGELLTGAFLWGAVA